MTPMTPTTDSLLLSVAEMYEADRRTIAAGTPGIELMEAAGTAVAGRAGALASGRPVIVLCGPGNNGGDGYVAARLLAAEGRDVRVMALGDPAKLEGDAATACERWQGPIGNLAAANIPDKSAVVVDALFGAGLTRPLEGEARATAEALDGGPHDVVAVDIPSGVLGDTGAVLGGIAFRARETVTFCRRKPGHFLYPGRAMCGEVTLADIGITLETVNGLGVATWSNVPANWFGLLPVPDWSSHKYGRGHAVIAGGAEMTGAARLAARAARRIGAGLVTIAAPDSAFAIYAAGDPGTLVARAGAPDTFAAFLEDPRRNAILVGPGAGGGAETQAKVEAALATGRGVVLDADALTAYADDPAALFARLGPHVLLTPHEGEFTKLFRHAGDGPEGDDRLSRARWAAERSGAVVLLKGPDTVVAHPDGRAAINANAPADLATAGSGDTLAGVVLGLVAQGMQTFAAAQAATWLHGAAAAAFGRGLIAEDLAELLPKVRQGLERRARSAYLADDDNDNRQSGSEA